MLLENGLNSNCVIVLTCVHVISHVCFCDHCTVSLLVKHVSFVPVNLDVPFACRLALGLFENDLLHVKQ